VVRISLSDSHTTCLILAQPYYQRITVTSRSTTLQICHYFCYSHHDHAPSAPTPNHPDHRYVPSISSPPKLYYGPTHLSLVDPLFNIPRIRARAELELMSRNPRNRKNPPFHPPSPKLPRYILPPRTPQRRRSSQKPRIPRRMG
jgi:hypothetical protein